MVGANNSWLFMSTVLTLLLIPATGLMYAGRVRSKSVINTLLMCFGALSVTTVIWTLWGWSLAFAGNDIMGIFADPVTGFLLKDSIVSQHGTFTAISPNTDATNSAPPNSVIIIFQLAIAIYTVSLITAALSDRIRYSTWLIFTAFWITFVYAPVAHMVFSKNGLLSSNGILSQALGTTPHDFAGGSLIHLNVSIATLAVIHIIGSRHKIHSHKRNTTNVPLLAAGSTLLWIGNLALNAGMAHGNEGVASYAVLSTILSVAASIGIWSAVEKIFTQKTSASGCCNALIVGLAAISSGADAVSPLWALMIGAIAGATVSYLYIKLKKMPQFNDGITIVILHGTGALIGLFLLGFVAQGSGLLAGGSWQQIPAQLAIILIVTLYSGVITSILAFALEKSVGWRVTKSQEIRGIDYTMHGETAYFFENVDELTHTARYTEEHGTDGLHYAHNPLHSHKFNRNVLADAEKNSHKKLSQHFIDKFKNDDFEHESKKLIHDSDNTSLELSQKHQSSKREETHARAEKILKVARLLRTANESDTIVDDGEKSNGQNSTRREHKREYGEHTKHSTTNRVASIEPHNKSFSGHIRKSPDEDTSNSVDEKSPNDVDKPQKSDDTGTKNKNSNKKGSKLLDSSNSKSTDTKESSEKLSRKDIHHEKVSFFKAAKDLTQHRK